MNLQYGVIFDVDGVLVDSYEPHFESWQAIAREESFTMTRDDFIATFGRTTPEIIREQLGFTHLSDAEVADWDHRKEKLYREIIAQNFPPMPAAVSLIDALAAEGFRLSVGSSGPPMNVDLVLKQLGREEKFHARVTGTDVTRGKPHPEVFQLAAQKLGLPPERCAVVEDAPAGVEASHAAGIVVVGLASTGRFREALREADLIVDSLSELSPQVFRDLIDRRRASR